MSEPRNRYYFAADAANLTRCVMDTQRGQRAISSCSYRDDGDRIVDALNTGDPS